MHPKYQTLSIELEERIAAYEAANGQLPGLMPVGARATLVAQMIESRRKIDRARAFAAMRLSDERSRPLSKLFDPELAAVASRNAGDVENAVWLAFLSVHFGRHAVDGWLLSSQFYGGLTQTPMWTWEAVNNRFDDLRNWLYNEKNFTKVKLGRFGNHRKYESFASKSASGTAAVIQSYINWIASHGSHAQLFAQTIRMTNGDPKRGFRFLYNEMDKVRRFGRLGKFDFLTLLEKLGLAEIEADSTYMNGATGPAQGARLLFANDKSANLTVDFLETKLDDLDQYLKIGMQALEDSLCNWQKSQCAFIPFRG